MNTANICCNFGKAQSHIIAAGVSETSSLSVTAPVLMAQQLKHPDLAHLPQGISE